ncbi:MAG: hypothetical protein J5I93_28560 [Pirellulaceae bacterium]|nr:hypothetical protein [Pirellulaceae bacterium]
MKVIHLQTTVQTIFGKLDEHGNVTQKIPVNIEVNQLTEETFAKLAQELSKTWGKLKEDSCPTPTE